MLFNLLPTLNQPPSAGFDGLAFGAGLALAAPLPPAILLPLKAAPASACDRLAGSDPESPNSCNSESISGAWARYFSALCTIPSVGDPATAPPPLTVSPPSGFKP